MFDRIFRFLAFFLFLVVLVLCVYFSFHSDELKNPDENHHIAAARYYVKYWLPPLLDDERIRDSYSKYGFTYLINLDPTYFFAGKFAAFINYLTGITDWTLLFRLFNIFCFAILFLYLSISRKDYIFFVFFLTPQLWYVFSYFSNDTFPFILSILVISSFFDFQKNVLIRKFKSNILLMIYLLLIGLTLGLLLFCKRNYNTFILFIGSYLIIYLIYSYYKYHFIRVLSRLCIITLVSLTIYFLINMIDVDVYGYRGFSISDLRFSNYNASIKDLPNKLALDEYKPENLKKRNSFFGMQMKSKEVPLIALFTHYKWHILKFRSFTGMYRLMDIPSPEFYYYLIAFLYGGFGLILFSNYWIGRKSISFLEYYNLLSFILFSILNIAVSVYFSWTSDFQPQGRYLFPIIAFLAVIMTQKKVITPSLLFIIILVAFLGIYSFTLYAIPKTM